MKRLLFPAALVATLPIPWGGWATGRDIVVEPRITVSEPRPVAATEDTFDVSMDTTLTPGLVVTIRVSPGGIELQRTRMMLVPKNPRGGYSEGDRIVIRSLAQGSLVSEVIARDAVVMFAEGMGQARREDRTLSVAIPTPTLVDTLEITVTASGKSKTFDVSQTFQEYCARAQDNPTCRLSLPDQGRP